jgi:hypothetical protein
MKLIKTALTAVFAVLVLSSSVPAAELNALKASDVRELSSSTAVPVARPLALRDAAESVNGVDPVVMTVPGLNFGKIGWGPFQLKYMLELYKKLFPAKKMDEADIAAAVTSFGRDYFLIDDANPAPEQPETRAMPDNYLEVKLKELPEYQDHNLVIVPFPWSRDPADSETTVPQLEKAITAMYDQYKGTGRPLFILAHSWGSVLTHEALHRLEKDRPDVKVDKLITAGSPLIPANFVVTLFVKTEVEKEHLLKSVTKPSNLKVWHNIWSSRDAYSNNIPAADQNFQTDADVEKVEPTLVDLILHNKLLSKAARGDLFKIRDIKAWHSSYFYDFRAELTSIHKEIFVPVFRPIVVPQIVDCAKNPHTAMCPI